MSVKRFLDTCDASVNTAYKQGLALKNDGQLERLKNVLERRLEASRIGRVEVYFLGSRAIGLAEANSDVDIYVEIDGNYNTDKNVRRDAVKLEAIEAALKNSSDWRIKVNITDTTVPLLKTIYVPQNLECDITVSNGLSVQNSLIMSHLFNLQPEIIKFYHFLRILLPRYDVQFDGYMLKLLVIFYFQNANFLPSILNVQVGLSIKRIDGWNVNFDPNRSMYNYNIRLIDNFKHHVANFFQYYATFNYMQRVMSVHDGTSKMRSSYEYQDEIRHDYMMCMFGPINKKHNIGKYVSKATVNKFQQMHSQ